MPDRKYLVSTLWLISAMALLTSVLVAPVQTSRFVTVSSRPECLRRNFAEPPGQPMAHLSAALTTDAVLEANDLPSENEEQDRVDALDEPRVPFLIPCSFRKSPGRQTIAPRSIPSLYPLRC